MGHKAIKMPPALLCIGQAHKKKTIQTVGNDVQTTLSPDHQFQHQTECNTIHSTSHGQELVEVKLPLLKGEAQKAKVCTRNNQKADSRLQFPKRAPELQPLKM